MNIKIGYIIFLAALLFSCNDEYDLRIVKEIQIINNPSGVAPLTAQLLIQTRRAVTVQMRVVGKNGTDSDVIQDFPSLSEELDLMVLGLYPNHLNQVALTFFNKNGKELGTEIISIQTGEIIAEMPEITINTVQSASMAEGLHFVNYMGHNGAPFPQRPFIFDNYGDIRWYLDYSQQDTLGTLSFDNGFTRLQNGHFITGDKATDKLYEINMYGEIINEWELGNHAFHHHVIEKPNGNLLVTVDDLAKNTFEDVVLEIDRTSGSIVTKWDLNDALDNSRTTWDTDLTNIQEDWFHGNGLAFDERDNTIIVSGRTQGVVKLTAANEVVWILAPHKGLATSGNGTDLTQYLLQPLDAQNTPISDAAVLNGDVNHTDFEWAWYQHSPILLANGNFMLFDNGDTRNYTGQEKYSRAVEYKIDETNKTIQQVWDYGKARGAETYSRIVSRVGYLEAENHVLFSSGAIQHNGIFQGKIIEINKADQQIIFEATIKPPTPLFIITFHNTHRLPLYPN